MYELSKLNNGLRIVTHQMPQMESVACGIWIASGSRYEQKKNSGISHFLEHLLFKGTKKRSSEDIKQAIEGRGGSLNGFTSEEFTCFLTKTLKKDFGLGLDILSDMVLNPLLRGDDMEKERTVILEEIKMYLDIPMHLVHELLDQLLWPDQPLGRYISGTIETVRQIKRADIVDYKRSFYSPKSMVVAVSGDINHRQVLQATSKYLARAPTKKVVHFKRVVERQKKPQFKFQHRKTEQTHIAIGSHALPRNHPDRYALDLLNIILGANMSSRLFQRVREEEGLAYDIRSWVRRYHDTGAFVISLGVENRKVIKALKVVLRELGKISKGLVSDDEFDRAREFYIGQLLLTLEDTADHMLWMGEKVLTMGRVPTIDEVLGKINKVKREGLRRVARRILTNQNLNLAIIGPVEDKDRAKIEKGFRL